MRKNASPVFYDKVLILCVFVIFVVFVSIKHLIVNRSSRGGFYFGTGERQSKQSAHFLVETIRTRQRNKRFISFITHP